MSNLNENSTALDSNSDVAVTRDENENDLVQVIDDTVGVVVETVQDFFSGDKPEDEEEKSDTSMSLEEANENLWRMTLQSRRKTEENSLDLSVEEESNEDIAKNVRVPLDVFENNPEKYRKRNKNKPIKAFFEANPRVKKIVADNNLHDLELPKLKAIADVDRFFRKYKQKNWVTDSDRAEAIVFNILSKVVSASVKKVNSDLSKVSSFILGENKRRDEAFYNVNVLIDGLIEYLDDKVPPSVRDKVAKNKDGLFDIDQVLDILAKEVGKAIAGSPGGRLTKNFEKKVEKKIGIPDDKKALINALKTGSKAKKRFDPEEPDPKKFEEIEASRKVEELNDSSNSPTKNINTDTRPPSDPRLQLLLKEDDSQSGKKKKSG